MLRLNTLDEYHNLQRDSWGIPKLPKDSLDMRDNAMGGKGLSFGSRAVLNGERSEESSQGLDVIVMPGVAFDQHMDIVPYPSDCNIIDGEMGVCLF